MAVVNVHCFCFAIFFRCVISPCLVFLDIDVYTKRKMEIFGEIPTQSTLWEQISLCSDVMEGAWYLLYDDHKKPNRPEKVKKLIRESIDNFHNKLVSDSKICISLAVFGPQGAGKSFFLNFLLNWGLSKINQGKDGPLPSGIGDSQTPLPIRVKHGSKVQVLLHRREKGMCQDVWFEDEELGIDTLSQVSHLLKTKFQEIENLSDAKCMELRGPFPVFRFLQEGLRVMTKSGHLELEVDVEFVDVPGRGANIGNESINIELSRADVVLFFQEGQAGRPVSAEDIAQIFRRREEFQFTSRPKLVHVFNDDREPPILSSCNFDLLQSEKKEDLDKAWSTLFSSGFEEGSSSGCYSDVRKRLPQLYGETLLDRLSEESDVVYFHPTNPGLLDYLKKMIADHVHNVKMKEAIHPFLQDVHWAAKKLRTRIGRSLTTEIKKSTCIAEDTVSVPFEMHCWDDELSDLAREFVDQAILPLQLDTEGAHPTFYHAFLNSEKTLVFLKDSLEASLDNFVNRLIAACNAASWATFQDFNELVEVLCRNRVQQFCENNAQTYLLHILKKVKIPKQRGKYKKLWPGASPEKKKEFCVDMVYNLLKQIVDSLMDLKGKRDNQYKKSHFHFRDRLIQDVNELLHVKCSHDDSKASVLKMLHGKLPIVIQFCTKSIREINPHPSLDVEKDTTLPEEMTVANAGNKPIPLESSHKKIIQDIANLLQPKKGRKRDCIGALETKLKLGKGALVLRQSQNAEEQHLWAKALVNVLSDKDHFDTPLPPSLTLDSRDPETEELLKLARKRLFAHQKSCATCKIVTKQAVPDDELHVKKASQDENCLEVWVSPKMCHILDTIRDGFVDPMQQIAPIFMPTIRPGPTADIRGNFFLEEDPWSKDEGTDDLIEEQDETVPEGEVKENKFSGLDLNIFLVVEKQHLKTLQSTVGGLKVPIGRNMMYVVLPQKGRGIGVTRAIIKSLVECLNFSLYWTIDDDVQYMYQFDANDRKWHKCSLVRGLLFGQRVFQTCLKKTVKEVSVTERFNLVKEVDQKYPNDDFKTTQSATMFLFDDVRFPQVLKNPGLLLSLFTHISEDCGGDTAREKEMKAFVQEFVEKCAKLLFHDSINHIAGVSIAHESSKRYDYMSKYPTADYMQSEQRYQVVLNNAPALKGMNFVTDDIIFHEDEDQVKDINKRNTPYWGVKGSDKSFCRALTLGGVIGYQVIRVVHSHKKLINVFDRVGPSYIGSQSPYGSEDEDEERQDVN